MVDVISNAPGVPMLGDIHRDLSQDKTAWTWRVALAGRFGLWEESIEYGEPSEIPLDRWRGLNLDLVKLVVLNHVNITESFEAWMGHEADNTWRLAPSDAGYVQQSAGCRGAVYAVGIKGGSVVAHWAAQWSTEPDGNAA